MAFAYSGNRSLVISDLYDSTTARESYSSRPLHLQSNPPHVTPRELMDRESYYIYGDKLTDSTRRSQGPSHEKYSKVLDEEAFIESYYSKRSLDPTTDDLFDHFDEYYQAKFPSNKDGVTTTNQIKEKPVCRDLFRELDIDIVKDKLGALNKETSVKSGKRSVQKPKELQASKPEKYYNIRASSNKNGGSRAVKEDEKSKYYSRGDNHHSHDIYSRSSVTQTNRSTNTSILNNESSRYHYGARGTHREDENVELEHEEARHRGAKNFVFGQNAAFSMIDSHYEAVQKTLSKIRRRDGRDVSGDWSILNDITNHHEKQVRRASVREPTEHRINGDVSAKRRVYEKESLENQKNFANQNDARKKINIADMIASYHSKENNHPSGRTSYNGKAAERSRSKEAGKIVQKGASERTNNYIRETQEVQTKRPSGIIERRNTKVEREKEPMTTYQALMKYYDLGKRGSKAGDASSGGRSTSMHRW